MWRASFAPILYLRSTKFEICLFWLFFSRFFTFDDLETNFSSRFMTSDDLWWPRVYFFGEQRPLFWYIICYIFSKFEIWPFWEIFDLGWPFLTSWPLFLKSWRHERHFDIQFTDFQWLLKFALFSEFLTSGDLCWPRDPFFWKADVKSVILIYPL